MVASPSQEHELALQRERERGERAAADAVRAGEAAAEAARREGELALQRQANEFELQVKACVGPRGRVCWAWGVRGIWARGRGTLAGRSAWVDGSRRCSGRVTGV